MDRQEQEQWLRRVNERLSGPLICVVCKNNAFTLAEYFLMPPAQLEVKDPIVIRLGKSVPMIVLVCNHCGWIVQMASKVLESDVPPNAKISPGTGPGPNA